MTDLITELDHLDALATPVPWKADVTVRGDCVVWGPDGSFIANAQAEPHWVPAADGGERAVAFDVDRRDVTAIARLRNLLPSLRSALDHVAALHMSYDGLCTTCKTPSPCATMNALNDSHAATCSTRAVQPVEITAIYEIGETIIAVKRNDSGVMISETDDADALRTLIASCDDDEIIREAREMLRELRHAAREDYRFV